MKNQQQHQALVVSGYHMQVVETVQEISMEIYVRAAATYDQSLTGTDIAILVIMMLIFFFDGSSRVSWFSACTRLACSPAEGRTHPHSAMPDHPGSASPVAGSKAAVG